jgi:membrane associated rhomboid family serine protease
LLVLLWGPLPQQLQNDQQLIGGDAASTICDDGQIMADLPIDIMPSEQNFDDWQPLPSRLEGPSDTTLSRRQMRSWSLVLAARHLPWRVERSGFGWRLLVPAVDFSRSLYELRQYEKENRGWPPPPPQGTPLIDNRTTTIWVLVTIGIFYNVTLHNINLAGHHPVDWTGLGNAHAGKIMAGDWWRLVTALTLHADWQHLLGNLLIGGFFISRLCRDLRSGPAWLLMLASGLLGNLLNAWLQHPDHRAVGASTAIFGAVGLLAAISMARFRHNLRARRRWTLPLAAALGLLAMLGAGGENTDLGAHLFGFLFGLPLGFAAELAVERLGRPGNVWNAVLAAAAVGIVISAWWSALLWGV